MLKLDSNMLHWFLPWLQSGNIGFDIERIIPVFQWLIEHFLIRVCPCVVLLQSEQFVIEVLSYPVQTTSSPRLSTNKYNAYWWHRGNYSVTVK